jgi:hypothetical protein
VFGIGTGDAVQGAQFPHPESGAKGGKPLDPGIAVGGVSGIQFVAIANPSEIRVMADGVIDTEGKVARDAENVLDAQFFQVDQDVLDQGLAHKNLLMLFG